MKKVLLSVGIIVLVNCMPEKKSGNKIGDEDVSIAGLTVDTVSNFMDLQNIDVQGDSVFLLFGVGEGGDEVLLKTKNKGPITEGVPKARYGVDFLDPMPGAYETMNFDFTYFSKPNDEILGTQFFIRYVIVGGKTNVVLLERRGNLSTFSGTWTMLVEQAGDLFILLYPDAATPTLTFNVEDGALEIILNRGQMADRYQVVDLDITKFGKHGKLELISLDGGGILTVFTEAVITEDGEYKYTTFSGFYDQHQKFVHENFKSLYPERSKN